MVVPARNGYALTAQRPISPKPPPLDDKLSALKAEAIEPQSGAATPHETGAKWPIVVALVYAVAASPVVFSSADLFDEINWSFLGSGSQLEFASGLFFGSLLAVGSAVFLARRRGQALTGGELAIYWFGAALPVGIILGPLFSVLGGSVISGLVIGAVLALASGILLLFWWRRRKASAELHR